MISSRKTKQAATVGLILVFASVLLFMQLFPRQEGRHWISLFFIVLGEILPFAGFIWLEDTFGKTMGPGLRVGIYSLFFVYGLVAVSMSLILLLLGTGAALLATLEIVLALAFGAILLFAAVIGGGRSSHRKATMAAVAFMRELEADVSAWAGEPANRVYGGQLRRIVEAIRYSDFSGRVDADLALAEKVRELGYVLREGEGAADAGAADTGAADTTGAGASGTRADDADIASASDVADDAGAGVAGGLRGTERGKQVELLTEDILRLVQDRNRALIDNKKARNYSDV